MKVTDAWKKGHRPTISFELFPARSQKAAQSLESVIGALAALKPDFVSVTFGAGGSTREGSHQLARRLKDDEGLDVITYFAGYGLAPESITGVLDSYQELGIENVLVVRGDPPHDEGFEPHPDSFAYASDLVAFIRPKYDFCLGVAGYPEGHIDAPSREKDLEYLKLKIDHGTEYIITNYFYNNGYYFDFVDVCRKTGIHVPIVPGIMPIFSVKMMDRLAKMCGATITQEIRGEIAALPEGDSEALVEYGIEVAGRQCAELLKEGVPGLHIYTMDRSKSTVGLVNWLRGEKLL
jgi:methylenetetrahydrofolate reductase (NADPH)